MTSSVPCFDGYSLLIPMKVTLKITLAGEQPSGFSTVEKTFRHRALRQSKTGNLQVVGGE